LGLPSGILLSALLPDACPRIPTIVDAVPPIANEFFDTRHVFLNLCQGNHYQFDSLRRARHSSMMVLYHLHNPSEPAFTTACNRCNLELRPGHGYRCTVCPEYYLCGSCYSKPTVTHEHAMEPHARSTFDATRMRLTEEDRAQREQALQRTMALLVHASACNNPKCPSLNCAKVKALFNHAVSCPTKITGGCNYCRRMWALLQAHAKTCTAADCPVPRCRELRMLRRKQAARQDDMRRKRYRDMLRDQKQEDGAPPG
jgi:E1A/CREB-binding protein